MVGIPGGWRRVGGWREKLNYVSPHILGTMPNVTLSVPEDLHKKMKEHPEIKWSEVIRRALAKKVHDLELMDRIASRSVLSTEDVDALDHLLKEALLQRYRRGSRV